MNRTLLIGEYLFEQPPNLNPGQEILPTKAIIKHVPDHAFLHKQHHFANAQYWLKGNKCWVTMDVWKHIGTSHNTIFEALFSENFGLMRKLGMFKLGEKHLELIAEYISFWKGNRPAQLDPGFAQISRVVDRKLVVPDLGKYDTKLALLLWLQECIEYYVKLHKDSAAAWFTE